MHVGGSIKSYSTQWKCTQSKSQITNNSVHGLASHTTSYIVTQEKQGENYIYISEVHNPILFQVS